MKRLGSLDPEGMSSDVFIDWDPSNLMTGREKYPLLPGACILQEVVEEISSKFEGLALTSDCLEKNEIVQRELRSKLHFQTIQCLGAIRVISGDGLSLFGFDFNPPIEFHAWLALRNTPKVIIDFSLPGLIIRGLGGGDANGPFLVNREPSILASEPPPWVIYQPVAFQRKMGDEESWMEIIQL